MNAAASVLALLPHAALLAVAAPLLEGLVRHMEAQWRGEAPPPVLQPWRDLVRLLRKTPVIPGGASVVFVAAPAVSAAMAGVAALLAPSFTLGTALAPAADLLVIAALLAGSRAVLALGAQDAGWAAPAHGGSRAMAALVGVAPVVLVAALALHILAGGTNIEAAAASVRDGGAGPHAAGLLAGLALLGAAASLPGVPVAAHGGRMAAMAGVATQLRGLAVLSVAASVAVPFGLAASGAGPGAWLLGVACWPVKLLVLAVLAMAAPPALLLPGSALLALLAVAVAAAQGAA